MASNAKIELGVDDSDVVSFNAVSNKLMINFKDPKGDEGTIYLERRTLERALEVFDAIEALKNK